MRKALLLSAVLLLAVSSFAATSINNFIGYNNTYYPWGGSPPSTPTYGEVFTVPDKVNVMTSFSFYMGQSYTAGNIVAGAYIATWTGTHAGVLLYDSGQFTYNNAGDAQLTFAVPDLLVTPGQQLVAFLSTTKFYGQSNGAAYVSSGSADDHLNGFAWASGVAFDNLFFSDWDEHGLSPDLAVDLEFDSVPEPGTLSMLGSGAALAAGLLKRRLA